MGGSFPVGFHCNTVLVVVDVVGDVVAVTAAAPFCFAPYVGTLFVDDGEISKCSTDAGCSSS